MQIFVALIAGAVFGAGLTIAQMVDPQKILNFLDVAAMRTGGWDPTLLFVFAGALPVMFAGYVIQRRMAKPMLAPSFQVSTRSDIDGPLVLGSALFGVGWGLIGICPGPALAALAVAGSDIGSFVLFGVAMLAGMWLSMLRAGDPIRGNSDAVRNELMQG